MNFFLNLTQDEFFTKLVEFKKLHSVPDMTIQQFKEVLRQEKEAIDAAEERESMGELQGSSTEESNAKCMACASGLSIIEAMLYGNRCIFCAETRYGFRFIEYLLSCYYDWRIYYAKMKLIDKTSTQEAYLYFTACMGNMGFTDINVVKAIKDKRKLLKELRKKCQIKNSKNLPKNA